MKHSRCHANSGPFATTSAVSAQAATKVPRLNATFSSIARSRWPTRASITTPASGMPRTMRSSPTSVLLLQRLEVAHVEAVELLADLEQEHAEDQHADE